MILDKKEYKILVTILLLIGLLIGFVTLTGISTYRKKTYEELKYEMMNFCRSSECLIDKYLSKLPDNYKDVDEIIFEYNTIKMYTSIVDNAYFEFTYDINPSRCISARKSYYNLLDIDEELYQWDLTNYLDETFRVIFFGVQWSNGSQSIEWYKVDNETKLYANLPNAKNIYQKYFYSYSFVGKNIIFSYENQENEADCFQAYKISLNSYNKSMFYINVYCYSNNTMYKLSSQILE